MSEESSKARLKSVAKQVAKAKEAGEKSVLVMKFSASAYEYERPKVGLRDKTIVEKAYGTNIVKKHWLKGAAAEFYSQLESEVEGDQPKYNLRLSSKGIEVIL